MEDKIKTPPVYDLPYFQGRNVPRSYDTKIRKILGQPMLKDISDKDKATLLTQLVVVVREREAEVRESCK